MIDKKLLPILVCPIDQSSLAEADEQILARLNRAITAGAVKNRAGQTVEKPIDGGLIRTDGTLLYPIINDIPILLADEAIDLEQIDN